MARGFILLTENAAGAIGMELYGTREDAIRRAANILAGSLASQCAVFDAELLPVGVSGGAGLSPNLAVAGTLAVTGASTLTGALTLGSSLQIGQALVGLGGGLAPTLGTIGGTGPAAAAQNSWMRVLDTTGAAFWVPAWK